MRRNLLNALCIMLVLMGAASCSEDDRYYGISIVTKDVYILNSGMMDSNNSELTVYNPSTEEVATNVFSLANGGRKLGDTANDMIRYGSKLYIAVTGSAVVFVTDLDGKVIEEIKAKGESANLSPRHMTAGNGKVFVTYQEGYVGAIDTASFNVKTAKTGPFPEGIIFTKLTKKLYVAITDGNNYPNFANRVEVFSTSSLEKIGEIETACNPQTFHYCGDEKIYLVCWGDYGAEPARLQIIDQFADAVTTVEGVAPTCMAVSNTHAYILSSEYDENWNPKVKYYIYNFIKDEIEGELVSEEEVPDGYSIFADDVNGHIYIGTSDYVNNGDMYVIRHSPNKPAEIMDKFDTGAINPIKVCFNRNINLQ